MVRFIVSIVSPLHGAEQFKRAHLQRQIPACEDLFREIAAIAFGYWRSAFK
jgi:hypothetical protein